MPGPHRLEGLCWKREPWRFYSWSADVIVELGRDVHVHIDILHEASLDGESSTKWGIR